MWSRHEVRDQWRDHTSFFHLTFFPSYSAFSSLPTLRGINQNSITIFYHPHEPVLPGCCFSVWFRHTHAVHMQTHGWMNTNQFTHTLTCWVIQMDSTLHHVQRAQKRTHSLHNGEMVANIIDLDYDFPVCIILSSLEANTLAVCACLFVSPCPHIYTCVPLCLSKCGYLLAARCITLSKCRAWLISYSNSQIGKPLCFWFEARKVV